MSAPQHREEQLLLLIDMVASGLLPLSYIFRKVRQHFSRRFTSHPARVAGLHNSEFPLVLAQAFRRTIRHHVGYEISYFPAEDHKRAVEWLLTGAPYS